MSQLIVLSKGGISIARLCKAVTSNIKIYNAGIVSAIACSTVKSIAMQPKTNYTQNGKLERQRKHE
jgi:hypothetical protein